MVKTILTGAGFVENKTFKETKFLKPPRETYAVYHDSFERRGADNSNLITEHDYTIELYSTKPDQGAEFKIEQMLDNNGLEFDKDERYWIPEEQLYQVIYTFTFIEK